MEVAAPGNPAGESALLRCLYQLNDDVLTAFLVPKLVEQGSAGAVALSCSQLRRLCHLSTQHLDLSKQLQDGDNPCHDPNLARQLVAAFPTCTSLEFAWASDSLVNVYHSITPLLAGLPHLSTLSIKLNGSSDGCDLDPVLCQMQVHATGLRCLNLQLGTSWSDQTDKCWASLGKMTNLTRLQLTFERQVTYPCSQTNLQPLTGLTKLQSLIITAPRARQRHVNADYAGMRLAVQQFPGHLTSLTELSLPLHVVHDISSVSGCVRLCDLRLLTDVCALREWGEQEWDALARLTSLTCLHVDLGLHGNDQAEAEAYYGVLRKLKALQMVGASVWMPSVLPVLQSLTHVTAVFGGWEEDAAVNLTALTCPHIKELGKTFGVPFQAFPNLVCVAFDVVACQDFLALTSYCTGLQKLVLEEFCRPLTWGHGVNPIERRSALRSLAHLQHLTHLELAPPGDAELVAFTSAAAALGSHRLRCLHVFGAPSVHALMQSLHGLQELHVHVSAKKSVMDTFTVEAVRMWLVGLAVVPRVYLVLHSAEQQSVVDAARQWATEMELPLPAVLKVSRA